MQTVTFQQPVQLPQVEDFLVKYPRFSALAAGAGNRIFNQIMQPEVFINARAAADFGLPSVLAVAEMCKMASEEPGAPQLDSFTKQFVGAAICSLMEANGYKKTDNKRSVPHPSFTVGEVYARA